ncbi:MAG: DUF5703 domain-containing protein [Prevotellaceae bacterium]|jgi:hypothetical protein|nr:DUF5703 domain-containing protein [Prevotellaceae bacterium]
MKKHLLLPLLFFALGAKAETTLQSYNVAWASQSQNSSESMPCGGGDIGLNVWTENNEVLFYISRGGAFDENNALLKLGRVRLQLSPNPFEDGTFKQELLLQEGYVKITGANKNLSAEINIWVDIFRPIIHVEAKSSKPMQLSTSYETWRHTDRLLTGKANNANSYKWAPQGDIKLHKDSVNFEKNSVLFFHRNRADIPNIFDVTVHQQGMDSVKHLMFDPVTNLTFGGVMQGKNMAAQNTYSGKYADTDFRAYTLQSLTPSRAHKLEIALHVAQTATINEWKNGLENILREAKKEEKSAQKNTRTWWKKFWERSYIFIEPDSSNTAQWQVGRNYQLFRYQLGCNAFGKYPTKFNGGLFTYDPRYVDTAQNFTPDHRNWGGGTHTAQNQRLVHFPMLRSGDFDMMKPQLDFYLNLQRNAELRSEVYWGHKGASFTEQLENFGLPNPSEYGWKRPDFYDKGMEYNAWLEYQWDTALEFCFMMLELHRYSGADISRYIPLIESCLTFFDEHYRYLAKLRGRKFLDENNHLVLYPGSACETYKMAYNASSTIAALQTVLRSVVALPDTLMSQQKKQAWSDMLATIPPISFREFEGKKTIAPAKLWERINNTEAPQLYPVFPWGIYGVGRPDLEVAINTYKYDTDALKFRSHVGWKQDNIFAARLGLTDEAAALTLKKLGNSERRFPTFWGPGFDWTPDHNWGGSGMIGLQEMLLQTVGDTIYVLPAFPKTWNVHFKLHAPHNTTVEVVQKNGKVEVLKVVPEARRKDIIVVGNNQ